MSSSAAALAPHYRAFAVDRRVLLTGHSHQAWPDVARDGLLECFDDAALHVDEKWARAQEVAERVRRGYRGLLDGLDGALVLTQSTHEALVRLLSALDLGAATRIVTTDGEFHSARRQLARLAQAGVAVEQVAARPVDTLADRLVGALSRRASERCALVVCSTVLFETAERVPGLTHVASACARDGVPLLLDAYHQLNVVPFASQGLEEAFIVGGGYKYCQLGEGVCFLRVPEAWASLRPVVTGWFGAVPGIGHGDDSVQYAEGPARWAGATYDPASHYRAAAVLDFFSREGLSPELLRGLNQRQLDRLRRGFDALDAPPEVLRRLDTPLEALGGFLALHTPHAARLVTQLRARCVHTDSRGAWLRLGPAPYVTDAQLDAALAALEEALGALQLQG